MDSTVQRERELKTEGNDGRGIIRQIIAAQEGWNAVYCQRTTNGQIKIVRRAIICWALIDDPPDECAHGTELRGVEIRADRLVVPMNSSGLDQLTNFGNGRSAEYFIGYDDPTAHKESDYWLTQASLRIEQTCDDKAES